MGAWLLALHAETTPSLFCLSRQPVRPLPGSDRSLVARGAYVIHGAEVNHPDLVLVATGAEVSRAIATAKLLSIHLQVQVVSMPSQKHFDAQPIAYRRATLPSNSSFVIAIEAWSSVSSVSGSV
jgi:dihydroxyacetone synthase